MHLLSLLFALLVAPLSLLLPPGPATTGDPAPVILNPGFEWRDGYHEQPGIPGLVPDGWTDITLDGNPFISSTEHWAREGCGPDAFVERLEGNDSLVFLAVPTRCGNGFVAPPFDAAVYQQVKVEPGAEYSLSAWMVSLCGGSASPNTCPAGAYMAKMSGLDPAGGTDPLSSTVQWKEDRRPHIEARWVNLIDATTAQTSTLTVFVRVRSPFLHEGNHAFADAVKLVRAPTSRFDGITQAGNIIAVAWSGTLGPDIPAIPATNHKLSLEVEAKRGDGPWLPWLTTQGAGSIVLVAPPTCLDTSYQFRVRAWAIQPDGQPGAWPNHRFVGQWHEPAEVVVNGTVLCSPRVYLPTVQR